MTKYRRRQLFSLLYATQQGQCIYCSRHMEPPIPGMLSGTQTDNTATFDHVKPRSLKGEDNAENVVLACFECNQAKGSDHRDRRLGPTPEEIITKVDITHRINIKTHLYALERMLRSASKIGTPREKKEAILDAHRFWEHELIDQFTMPKSIISLIQESALYLREQAVADCWEPLHGITIYVPPRPQNNRYRPGKPRRKCLKRHAY